MNNLELLESYEDWKAQQKYRDDGPDQFLREIEDQRLVRNASAVLRYLEEGVEDQDKAAVTNTVWYLLNASIDDREVEEWLSGDKPTGQEWVTGSGLDPAIVAAATTGVEWTPEDEDDPHPDPYDHEPWLEA